MNQRQSVFGWLACLFALIIVAQAHMQERAKFVPVYVEPTQIVAVQQFRSNPINLSGACWRNIEMLHFGTISIEPGQTWSFNNQVGNPDDYPLEYCGPLGGGHCNYAAAIAIVGQQAGLSIAFQDHGIGDIGQGPQYSVSIWNVNNRLAPDDQDLTLSNKTSKAFTFWLEGQTVVGELR